MFQEEREEAYKVRMYPTLKRRIRQMRNARRRLEQENTQLKAEIAQLRKLKTTNNLQQKTFHANL